MCDIKKWVCEYCTYENFPATKKCTLCRNPRRCQLISDGDSHRDQDIYQLGLQGSLDISPNGSSGLRLSTRATIDHENKWSCRICTYLNWPHLDKCIQCDTHRGISSPLSVRQSVSKSKLKPLSVQTDLSPGSSQISRTIRTSPSNRNTKTRAGNQQTQYLKWNCLTCTYENWAQSLSCVMCCTPKTPGSYNSESLRSNQISPSLDNLTSSLSKTSNTSTSQVNSAISQVDESNHCVAVSKSYSPPATSRKSLSPQNSGATMTNNVVTSISECNNLTRQSELRLKLLRKRLQGIDWLFLNACNGVLDGDVHSIEAYLHAGGDPTRQLTSKDVLLLNQPSAFEPGFTLIHLAIRFKREDILALLLTSMDTPSKSSKRLPSHASPDVITEIRRDVSTSLRQRKGDFACFFLTKSITFSLPAEIEDFADEVQKQLLEDLMDKDVQNDLELEESVINWSVEVTDRLGSRLYALWNRTAGDCLLDSVLQATWGILDIDSMLRRTLAESLSSASLTFYSRWREFESLKAQSLQFALDESQWQRDWAVILSLANQPGAALEQTHIFALAHIFRRPIIVYGVKYVKSFRGETLGFAGFQGVYLPLLWEQSFCWKTPIVLGYTRGHFSALVAMEMNTDDTIGAGANIDSSDDIQTEFAYLPLVDNENKLLPIHFLSGSEIGRQEEILKKWLDCQETKGGILVAVQQLNVRPVIVKQMVDEWLDHYRQLSNDIHSQNSKVHAVLSSDGESDDE